MRSGVTILEVVVALSIVVALLVPVLALSTSDAKLSAKRLAEVEQAARLELAFQRLAFATLDELRTLPASLDAALPAGWDQYLVDPAAGEGVRVSFEPDVDGRAGLHRVSVRLTNADGRQLAATRLLPKES